MIDMSKLEFWVKMVLMVIAGALSMAIAIEVGRLISG